MRKAHGTWSLEWHYFHLFGAQGPTYQNMSEVAHAATLQDSVAEQSSTDTNCVRSLKRLLYCAIQ